jgi:hypothetical protein
MGHVVKRCKVRHITDHGGQEGEQRYISTLSSTSDLDKDGWLTPRSSRITPGKETRYPLYIRLGGPQDQSGRMRNILPPPEFDPPTV